jgi:hypothetical protein
MFSKKARIAFRLVDASMTVTEALQGPPSPASEVLYDFKTRTPYLLLKEIAVEGNDIIDAAPGFDPQSHQPIASFRFNARGTRHFAHITEDNVGSPGCRTGRQCRKTIVETFHVRCLRLAGMPEIKCNTRVARAAKEDRCPS